MDPDPSPSPSAVLRFAPSPNGLLHLGHAYSALMNRRLAARVGARLLLRLEDIDPLRCREEFAAAVEEDLAWLGVAWEGPVRRQSAHLRDYAAAIEGLAARRLAYPCFCTRGLIAAAVAGRPDWPHDPDDAPLYPGLCRHLPDHERQRRIALGQPFAWRLDMAVALALDPAPLAWVEAGEDGAVPRIVAAEPARWGDALIARKDVPTSYHVSVVIDDAVQGVTDVVRGRDLFAATALQRLLQRLFGLAPPRYRHHRLILDEASRKLSKRHQARSLRSLRREGVGAQAVRASLGFD